MSTSINLFLTHWLSDVNIVGHLPSIMSSLISPFYVNSCLPCLVSLVPCLVSLFSCLVSLFHVLFLSSHVLFLSSMSCFSRPCLVSLFSCLVSLFSCLVSLVSCLVSLVHVLFLSSHVLFLSSLVLFLSSHIQGQVRPGVEIETYDDHRVAMCFSLAACAGVPVTILDPKYVMAVVDFRE